MFWKKSTDSKKLPKPKALPGIVATHLEKDKIIDPDLVKILLCVVKKKEVGDTAFDIRIFDEAEMSVKKVKVNDYTTLDEHPNLVIYEGWYDEHLKKVELEQKKRFGEPVTIFTEPEIRQKIEAMSQPGSTVYFYLARGPTFGGPLGRGAAVVELNPHYPGKKQKKYIIYTADVDGMEPVGKGTKLYDSDKSKEIANWIKDGHQKRIY